MYRFTSITIKRLGCFAAVSLFYSILLTGCFTGVEGTKRISEKEVIKANAIETESAKNAIDTLQSDPLMKWETGKKFYVTDNQIKHILSLETTNSDSLNLENNYLFYSGCSEENMLGVEKKLVISFTDEQGRIYRYNSLKSFSESQKPEFSLNVPFLIDIDVVNKAKSLLSGKEIYVKTPIWYDESDAPISGERFAKIKILDVLPGNKVYTLRIKFIHGQKIAYMLVATKDNPILNRSFDNLFSATNPREKYPLISDENWTLIVKGKIKRDMTKEECQLSLGSPKVIDKIPTYQGLREIWQYENGVYLIFEDGILVKYRK